MSQDENIYDSLLIGLVLKSRVTETVMVKYGKLEDNVL